MMRCAALFLAILWAFAPLRAAAVTKTLIITQTGVPITGTWTATVCNSGCTGAGNIMTISTVGGGPSSGGPALDIGDFVNGTGITNFSLYITGSSNGGALCGGVACTAPAVSNGTYAVNLTTLHLGPTAVTITAYYGYFMPLDYKSTGSHVSCVSYGGAGGVSVTSGTAGAGGGSSGFTQLTGAVLTGGNYYPYLLGTTADAASYQYTAFAPTQTSPIYTSAHGCGARPGGAGSASGTPGAAGTAVSGYTINDAGAAGGSGGSTKGGGGGGGAPGPNGVGVAGTAGGVGTFGPGGNGDAGSGGAGGASAGAAGGNGAEWTATAGGTYGLGGGGAGAGLTGLNGGAAGLYGAGGAGNYDNGTSGTAGAGGGPLIEIDYTSSTVSNTVCTVAATGAGPC